MVKELAAGRQKSLGLMVYIAPVKALCSEKLREWTTKFGTMASFLELTGDSTNFTPDLSKYDVVLTTPEKWDVVTRRQMTSCRSAQVRLVMVDEVHLLSDAHRGHTLEAVITRIKSQVSCEHMMIEKIAYNVLLADSRVIKPEPRADPVRCSVGHHSECKRRR